MSRTPHDEFFKAVFSIKEEAVAFLQKSLPRRVFRALDLASLELQEGTFVDIRTGKKATDLLFKVRMRGREVLIYILLEHQSEADPMMPARIHIYVGRIWARWLKDHPHAKTLPLVLPVVLHHGRRAWQKPKELPDLVEIPASWRRTLSPYLPRLEWILVDLARIGDSALRRHIADMKPMAALALILLKHLRWNDPIKTLRPWKRLLRRLSREPESMAYWATISEYVYKVQPRFHREPLARFLEEVAGMEAKNMVLTMAEWLRKKGRREGLVTGRAKGRAEGRAEGASDALRTALREVLRARFGEIPKSTEARIDAAPPEVLKVWIARAATAATIRASVPR